MKRFLQISKKDQRVKMPWLITGANSQIAGEFAHLVAKAGHSVILVGRDEEELKIMVTDLIIRYKVKVEFILCDFAKDWEKLLSYLNTAPDLNLFLAHSHIIENQNLSSQDIHLCLKVNVESSCQLIFAYMQKKQSQHRLIFLSSVAACKGRGKNSLYAATKAAVEVYIQGLMQKATKTQFLSIIRLGFIDTKQTFGKPGIFFAAHPKATALACWQANNKAKRLIYYPSFWRYLMGAITHLPFFLYKKIDS